MLEACQQYVVAKRSNLTHWHPVLGWFAQTIDTSLQESIPFVKFQLACLWTGRIVTHLIGELLILHINYRNVLFFLFYTLWFFCLFPRTATDRTRRERSATSGRTAKQFFCECQYFQTCFSRSSHQQKQQHKELQEAWQPRSY